MLTAFTSWRRYDEERQHKMQAALKELASLPDLAPDLYEIVNKSLSAE